MTDTAITQPLPRDTRFVVAEISKNWYQGHSQEKGLLAERFEAVIEINHRRGYRLQSFSLHRLMTGPEFLNETIIAVFERA